MKGFCRLLFLFIFCFSLKVHAQSITEVIEGPMRTERAEVFPEVSLLAPETIRAHVESLLPSGFTSTPLAAQFNEFDQTHETLGQTIISGSFVLNANGYIVEILGSSFILFFDTATGNLFFETYPVIPATDLFGAPPFPANDEAEQQQVRALVQTHLDRVDKGDRPYEIHIKPPVYASRLQKFFYPAYAVPTDMGVISDPDLWKGNVLMVDANEFVIVSDDPLGGRNLVDVSGSAHGFQLEPVGSSLNRFMDSQNPPQDLPHKGLTLELSHADLAAPLRTTTDDEGAFTFNGVPDTGPWDINLLIEHPQFNFLHTTNPGVLNSLTISGEGAVNDLDALLGAAPSDNNDIQRQAVAGHFTTIATAKSALEYFQAQKERLGISTDLPDHPGLAEFESGTTGDYQFRLLRQTPNPRSSIVGANWDDSLMDFGIDIPFLTVTEGNTFFSEWGNPEVILHEIGHAVRFFMMGTPNVGPFPLSSDPVVDEASADIFKMIYAARNGSALEDLGTVGRGFQRNLPESFIRDFRNGVSCTWDFLQPMDLCFSRAGHEVWPALEGARIHERGMVFSRFALILLEKLIERHGQEEGVATFEAMYFRYLDSFRGREFFPLTRFHVLLFQVADDHPENGGNNDLSDKSPNADLIEDAGAIVNLHQFAFIRGDANSDGKVDIADPISILNTAFIGGNSVLCEDAADANDDSRIDIADAVSILMHLFTTGDGIAGPGLETCATDPIVPEVREDRLTCAVTSATCREAIF